MGRRNAVAVMGVAVLVSAATGTAWASPPEFSGPYPNAFQGSNPQGASPKPMVLRTVVEQEFRMTCQTVRVSGEVTGPQTVKLKPVFEGCQYRFGGCEGLSHRKGVVLPAYEGTLGYLNAAHTAVGADFVPPNGWLEIFGCGEDTGVGVEGSIVGRLTPVNKAPAVALHLAFRQKDIHQVWNRLFEGPLDVPLTRFAVGGGEWNTEPSETGIELAEKLRFDSPIQVTG